ncbi:(deoxy)nucleoside triphosphate pyrophosphohydrolase [Labedaea rhizosphaerae]|uniref:8-oxo-dGTP diphosphatase n=1 Tax=Labedaea rhizosphaerae TaxID=598644 RepID=A0A4R6SIP4_LABRH|nr:(deoxy)nucleoside triphosphate pyrophosphohydrolase [Labedaea rhizosphaerae]TDQ04156.1 8-oxo-dGTP diphosphatase [Labedaea rhizosphaerae]
MYRTTALIDAPASVVAAALLELAGSVAPGDPLTVGRVRARLVEASARRVSAVALSGPPRQLAADLAVTPAGTLLTATVDGRIGRRRALALVEGLAERAARRARELAQVPVVVATAIIQDEEVLAQQRAFPPETAGRWELPGGRVEPGESEVDAVRRECREELGVDVEPGGAFGPDVVLAGGKYLLRSYRAGLVDGEPKPREHQAVRWLTDGTLGAVDWLPADRVLLPELRALLRR